MRPLSVLVFSFLAAIPAGATSHPCAFGPSLTGTFADRHRGDSFTISTSNHLFVPADIVLGEVGGGLDPPPGPLTLYLGDHQIDRYGRQPVQLFQNDRWLQGDMLRNGNALALPVTQRNVCQQALLDAESKNTASRGNHWRARGVEIDASDLDTLSDRVGRFVVVTGIVRSVGDRARRLYLNFGENWAHDFTVSIAKQGAGKFTGDFGRLTGLKGKKVQIRGVLEDNRGPLIRVIDDVQVQIIK